MVEWLSLSEYKMLSTMELIVAMCLFMSAFPRRSKFFLRASGTLAVIFTVIWFFPIVEYNVFWVFLLYMGIFSMVLFGALFCFHISWRNLLFCGIAAYLIKHLAYVVLKIVTGAISGIFDMSIQFDPYREEGDFFTNIELGLLIACYLAIYFLVYWFGYFLCAIKVRITDRVKLGRMLIIVLAGVILLFALLFSLLMSFNQNKDVLSSWIELGFSLLLCIVVLWLQFSKLSEAETNYDLLRVRDMLLAEQRQYAAVKQNMDIVNVKCHDIKHMISDFRSRAGIFEDELTRIEESVGFLGSVVVTGNDTLDMVLTDKIRCAENKGILLSCMADGSLLSFMKPSDIYSLVGNALDNAINAVDKTKEEGKSVSFFLRRMNEMTLMRVENVFNGELRFVNGLPRTMSGDDINHGYGMLSIKMVAESYGGTVSVNVEKEDSVQNIFCLNVLFPQINKDVQNKGE